MRIARETLLHALQSIAIGLTKAEAVRNSHCFRFFGGNVATFNGDVLATALSGLPREWPVLAVPARKLLDHLIKADEIDIDIDLRDEQLIVTGCRNRSEFDGFTKEVLDERFPAVYDRTPWQALPDDFDRAARIVSLCCDFRPSEAATYCVHWKRDFIEASDTHQFARWYFPNHHADDYVFHGSTARRLGTLGLTQYTDHNDWLIFRNHESGLHVAARLASHDYADLSDVLTGEGVQVHLTKSLRAGCDKAKSFLDGLDKEQKYVQVSIYPQRVYLKAVGDGARYAEYEESTTKPFTEQPVGFVIKPDLLKRLLGRDVPWQIGHGKLKIIDGSYCYVSFLRLLPEDES